MADKIKMASESNLRLIISMLRGLMTDTQSIAEQCINEYDPDRIYAKDRIVLHDNKFYLSKTTTTGTWNDNAWTLLADDFKELTVDEVKALINLSEEEIQSIQNILKDDAISTNYTHSSSKIYSDILDAIKTCKDYTLQQIALKVTGSYKIVTSQTEMTSSEHMYLLLNASNKYDIYVLVEGTPTKVGDTNVNLDGYYKKTEVDTDFLKKTDAASTYKDVTSYDSEIGDLTTLTTTATDVVGAINEVKEDVDNKKISNRNLFDNGWFTVNTRNSSGSITSDKYGVDRWTGVYTINSDGTLSLAASNYIVQHLDADTQAGLFGKQFSVSVKYTDDSIVTFTNTYDNTQTSNIATNIAGVGTMSILKQGGNHPGAIAFTAGVSGANIKAIKLELGSISTLVNDIAPNYQEELIKCMTSTADVNDIYANRVPNFASNPNLLDNPWFTVNQRGQTSYATPGYTVDRWYYMPTYISMVVNNDGTITITNTDTTNARGVLQKLETPLEVGKSYTVSVITTSDELYSIQLLNSSYASRGVIQGNSGTFTVTQSDETVVGLFVKPNSSITIKAVKLELGSISTLAMDVAPSYGVELAKCETSKADSSDTYANKVMATTDNMVKTKTVSVTVQSVHPNFSIQQLASNITVLSMSFVSTTSPYFLGLIVPFIGTNNTWYGSIVGVADGSSTSAFLSKTLDVIYTYIEK